MRKESNRPGLACLIALIVLTCVLATSLQKAGGLDGAGTLESPLTFWAQDANEDGLFDELWVNVSFAATIQDGFRFDLHLNDSGNSTQIAHVVNDTYLLPGSHLIPMMVDGIYFNSTWKWNGPFVASVKVMNGPGRVLAWTSATSPAYPASAFKHPPATAITPFGDRGVDLDLPPDGLFNQLRISVSVNYTEPGPYMLSVFISRPFPPFAPIATATRVVYAQAGEFTYDMPLSGTSIRSSGLNGPYLETLCVWALPDPGQTVKVAFTSNTSMPYLPTDFQSRPVVAVGGTVRDDLGNPLPGASIVFVNYTDLTYDQTLTDSFGGYTANLHVGQYLSVVTRQGWSADNATEITVTGAGPYDFTIRNPPPSVIDIALVMPGDRSVERTIRESRSRAVASTKLMIEWNIGDRDGYVSPEESAMFARSILSGKLFDDTLYDFRVDDTFYYPYDYAGIASELNYTGPILSKAPRQSVETVPYLSNSAVARQINHVIDVNVSYDRSDRESRTTLRLPPGWIATASTPIANISVSGMSTSTVSIDPLSNPNPTGQPDYAWIQITAVNTTLIPPTIQGLEASPNPQEFDLPVHISAWVNDSSFIARVSLEIFAPVSGPIGNFTMTRDGPLERFSYGLVGYPDLGEYSFTIWATDTDENSASAGGRFTVRDTTTPVANPGLNQAIYTGALIILDGSMSTDNHDVSNWTWTFNEYANNITLYGRVVTHTFREPGTHPVLLTVRDSSGNYGTATLSVVVVPGGDFGGFMDIPVSWMFLILLVNTLSLVGTCFLAAIFLKWARILRHAPFDAIASGFYVLTASFAFIVAFGAILVTGPSPFATATLLAALSLQTIAYSYVAAGYGLWKAENKATWAMISLTALLGIATAVVALGFVEPSILTRLDFTAMMEVTFVANLSLLALITTWTLRAFIKNPKNRTASAPAGFGLIALGQSSLLIWSSDGGAASIVLASIVTLTGLTMLLRTALGSRRPADNG